MSSTTENGFKFFHNSNNFGQRDITPFMIVGLHYAEQSPQILPTLYQRFLVGTLALKYT